jgi:TDG/mug DNA glycosylase family protein
MINDILALACGWCSAESTRASPRRTPVSLRPSGQSLLEGDLSGRVYRQVTQAEEEQLLDTRCGITMLVERPTVQASEVNLHELRSGGRELVKKIEELSAGRAGDPRQAGLRAGFQPARG